MSVEEISCNCAQLFGFSAAEDGVRPEQEPFERAEYFANSELHPTNSRKSTKKQSVFHPSIFLSPLIVLSGGGGSLCQLSAGEGGQNKINRLYKNAASVTTSQCDTSYPATTLSLFFFTSPQALSGEDCTRKICSL